MARVAIPGLDFQPRQFPLPEPEDWKPVDTNDNPWDWLRLDTLYAYPPKIVEREIRKPRPPKKAKKTKSRKKPIRKKPKKFKCVEIQCFRKGPPQFPGITCRCGADRHWNNSDPPRDAALHETVRISIRHNRVFNLPTFLVFDRRRFKCINCGDTFSEEFKNIYTHTRVTHQFREDIIMTAIKRPFSDAAALMSVDDMYVKRTFRLYAATRLKDYRFVMPRAMGVDEVHIFNKKEANFVVTDLTTKRILDFGEGRTFADIAKIFRQHKDRDEWSWVKVFVQDMNKDYRKFARANFKEAAIVVDKFHVLSQVNDCMNSARIAFGRSEGVTDEDRRRLSQQRFLFLGTDDKLTVAQAKQRDEILAGSAVLSAAYKLKCDFYNIYQQKTREAAEARHNDWIERVMKEQAVHFRPVIAMMSSWHNEIFNYFDYSERYNNGFVEGLNSRLRRMHEGGQRIDFKTFRAKALLRYGTFIGDDRFMAYSIERMSENHKVRARDEGKNVSSGLNPDALFADWEGGSF